MKVTLRHASIGEKRKTFEWLSLADTTAAHTGPPLFPEIPVLTWDEFRADFEDFYYEERGREKGSVMIVEADGQEAGCLCYSRFHLQDRSAELDIWLSQEAHCGKGIGTEALKQAIRYLRETSGVKRFIIRPSLQNARAVRAYEKAGFRHADDIERTLREYLADEYYPLYCSGDYGPSGTATMTLEPE